MTRIAVLADIHGNLPALTAVLDHMPPVDHVVVAGDLINLGPFSREVVEMALKRRWSLIRGNHAYYLLDHNTPRGPAHWHGHPVGSYLMAMLADLAPVIAGWPDELSLRYRDAPPVRVLHGLPSDPFRGIFPDATEREVSEALAHVEETTVITAHTHLPFARQIGHWQVINPGSVGMPFDGDPRAGYAVLTGTADGWHAALHRVLYDQGPLLRALAAYADLLGPIHRLVAEQFRRAQPILFGYNQWVRAREGELTYSDALLDAFFAEDPATYFTEHYA